MSDKPRILGVGCHPDDLEILCGGTLARYAAEGHSVTMAVFCNGDKGHYEIPLAELARIRAKEFEAAAAVIGADTILVGVPDGMVYDDHESRLKLLDVIREARPDVILTHTPNCYYGDHTNVSQMVCDSSFLAGAPLHETELPAAEKIPPVYFMDTAMGVGFDPQEYVDMGALGRNCSLWKTRSVGPCARRLCRA